MILLVLATRKKSRQTIFSMALHYQFNGIPRFISLSGQKENTPCYKEVLKQISSLSTMSPSFSLLLEVSFFTP